MKRLPGLTASFTVLFALLGCAARPRKIGNVQFLNCKVIESTVVRDGQTVTEYRSCDCAHGVLMWDAKKKQEVVKCGEMQ